jgi:hypothetical protein
VPQVPVGRPRRFCSDRCAAIFSAETKRRARDLADAERERDEALARYDGWGGVSWSLRAASLTAEVNKLAEELARRRRRTPSAT